MISGEKAPSKAAQKKDDTSTATASVKSASTETDAAANSDDDIDIGDDDDTKSNKPDTKKGTVLRLSRVAVDVDLDCSLFFAESTGTASRPLAPLPSRPAAPLHRKPASRPSAAASKNRFVGVRLCSDRDIAAFCSLRRLLV
jgi:hypothetical protein